MSKFKYGPLLAAALFAGSVLPATAADTYTKTKYPLLMVHGLFGFEKLGGVVDYFYGIPGALRSGGATVYFSDESMVNSNEVRGEQLIERMETLQALYGHEKFNLIGHSQGSGVARYAASVRPDLVASWTGFDYAHSGNRVADLVTTLLPEGSPLRPLVASFVEAIVAFVDNGAPEDAVGAVTSMDTPGAARFTAKYPEGKPTQFCGQAPSARAANGVYYYSFSGTGVFTNVLDPFDYSSTAGGALYAFFGEQSDGLVSRCPSHWGQVIRDDYNWNHFDAINQVLGLRSWFSSDPEAVYRSQANRLKNAGL